MKKALSLKSTSTFLYRAVPALILFPFVSAPIALAAGLTLSFFGHEDAKPETGRTISFLLQASIVLMGFGMNLGTVLTAGISGFKITLFSVVSTILVGLFLGWIFRVDKKTSYLISVGTAICGGSAIAATAPVLKAENRQISFALATIFILNSVALFLFPVLGHIMHLSQETFGYWAAIAIHDTSSVVGAGSVYGPHALEIATTVKLTRALWIIPVTIITALINKSDNRINIPWFIPLFVVAMIVAHYIPHWSHTFAHLSWLGEKGLLVALFFIGAGISKKDIKSAGWRPVLMGLVLWTLVSVSSILILN
ncbi:YeiH family protein [Prolixibacter sp. NT017]|uniref:YeiH family protein n=1 Tax=Prolixibacter sp. NT017 TaxID=2652390 RepID=UPI00127840C0|nr:putative sulfate exporter family transporter [Prolixibacter sp. NT017]GET24984.1 membrane protein [Prolixibacter sp. NT017]